MHLSRNLYCFIRAFVVKAVGLSKTISVFTLGNHGAFKKRRHYDVFNIITTFFQSINNGLKAATYVKN